MMVLRLGLVLWMPVPTRAKRPCNHHGCNVLINGRYCDEHKADDKRPSAAKRGYGRGWQRIRIRYLRRHPLCVDPFAIHADDGVIVVATDVDHIIKRRDGGSDASGNLQSLCHSCHSKKTGAGQ